MAKQQPQRQTEARTAGEVADDLEFDAQHEVIKTPPPTDHAAIPSRPAIHAAVAEIDATAINPGIECPFTDGCAEKGGKVRIHSDTTIPVHVNGKIERKRVHQYRCNRCNVIAKGHKEVGSSIASGGRFFNRLTGKSE